MKKYFTMIALAITSMMVFTGCHKESVEIIDPMEGVQDGNHDLEIEIDAALEGSYTKAVSLTIKYVDFNSDKEEVVVLNKDFDGQNTSFKKKFRTTKKGEVMGICVTPTTVAFEDYKDLPTPWLGKCHITVKDNGRELDETNVLSLTDNEPAEHKFTFFGQEASYLDFIKAFRSHFSLNFGGEMIYFKISDKNGIQKKHGNGEWKSII